jgi:hypothetical protein
MRSAGVIRVLGHCIGKHTFIIHVLFGTFVCSLFNKAVSKPDDVNLLADNIDTMKKTQTNFN